jgi:hypothetical protein
MTTKKGDSQNKDNPDGEKLEIGDLERTTYTGIHINSRNRGYEGLREVRGGRRKSPDKADTINKGIATGWQMDTQSFHDTSELPRSVKLENRSRGNKGKQINEKKSIRRGEEKRKENTKKRTTITYQIHIPSHLHALQFLQSQPGSPT